VIVPYVVYYSLRYSNAGEELVEMIAKYVNEVFDSTYLQQIDIILKMFDFFSCSLEQDKQLFKTFIESETKFKYVEKLFFLELNSETKDQNIINFTKIVNGNEEVKQSFLVVKRMMTLLAKFDKQRKNKAAKKVNSLKRCVFNLEDNYRCLVNATSNKDKSLLDFLPNEETLEVFSLHRRLNPDDFEIKQFQTFVESLKVQHSV